MDFYPYPYQLITLTPTNTFCLLIPINPSYLINHRGNRVQRTSLCGYPSLHYYTPYQLILLTPTNASYQHLLSS